MNKGEFIEAVAKKSGESKAQCQKFWEVCSEVIMKALKSGAEVNLTPFGKFYVTKRSATTGRNPRTGATIQIKARKQPKFKSGKGLKDAVA
jgi:DNA-binding protein HU-beta